MTWRDDGRWWRVEDDAGELGTDDVGDEDADELAGDWSKAGVGCGDLHLVGEGTMASPAETVRVSDWKLRLGVSTVGDARPTEAYCQTGIR